MTRKVLVLGCTGMIGHMIFRKLSERDGLDVYGTAREHDSLRDWFGADLMHKIKSYVDAMNMDSVLGILSSVKPDVVINCLGLIKQLPIEDDPLSAIAVNSLLPHRIAKVCQIAGSRMIHMSTDCVFRGDKGNYSDDDISDAVDLYGRSKYLGEVSYPHCVTLRTSAVGHELRGNYGLVEWFLAQEGAARGFKKVFFSGTTTVELGSIIANYVLPNERLTGIYNVSSSSISKYDFLKLFAATYQKDIVIEPCDDVCLDRSLNSSMFRRSTGYVSPSWQELIDKMHDDYIANHCRGHS